MAFVLPEVFMVGYTEVNIKEVIRYLEKTGQQAFLEDFNAAMAEGISGAEALCSMFAKLCYRSLVVGKNANITKVREIRQNLEATFESGHGSVFEHVGFNFICTDVSRVFTHELVRHRAGTAFSQTSGRYCRPADNDGAPQIDFVHDPILDAVKPQIEEALHMLGYAYRIMEIRLGLLEAGVADKMRAALNNIVADPKQRSLYDLLHDYKPSTMDFTQKKKLTSAMRRILPNGQSNEIAFSCNIRTLRHCVQIRTQRFAEWEIRVVFAQIYNLVKAKFPMVFSGAKETMVEGLPEVHSMKLQPYDVTVEGLPTVAFLEEIRRRKFKFADKQDLLDLQAACSSQLNELERVG